jgi:hypothetical protein
LYNNQRFVALLGQNVNELHVFIGSIVHRCIWFVPSLTFWFNPQTHGKQLPKQASRSDRHGSSACLSVHNMQPTFASLFQLGHSCFILFYSLLLSGLSKDKTAPAGDMDHDRASCAFFTLIRHPFITVSSMANAPTGMFPAFRISLHPIQSLPLTAAALRRRTSHFIKFALRLSKCNLIHHLTGIS